MISIIIPIYNAAPYLRQCLDSVLTQTCTDWEAILIDDASTDNSAAIAAEYIQQDTRFTLLRQEINKGQSAARNKGLDKAKGEYIAFLDADDYLDENYLEKHIEAISNADYVQSGYRRISINGNILEQKIPRHCYQFTTPWGRLYRASFIRKHRILFPINMIYEDVLFSLDLWYAQPRVVMLPYIGYNYICNPLSTTAKRHTASQQLLIKAIYTHPIHIGLKLYTLLRLRMHFMRCHYIQNSPN